MIAAVLRFWRSLGYTRLTQAEAIARLDALLPADQRRGRAWKS